MSSQKQINANRRNALTHGLTAADIVLTSEDDAPFEELLQAFLNEYDPQTPTEHTLLEQLVCAAWRLRRVRSLEQGIFNNRLSETTEYMDETYEEPSPSLRLGHIFLQDASGPEALTALSRFEGRIERSYYRALRELQRIRDLRPKNDLQKQTQFDGNADNLAGTAPVPADTLPEASPRQAGTRGGTSASFQRPRLSIARRAPVVREKFAPPVDPARRDPPHVPPERFSRACDRLTCMQFIALLLVVSVSAD